MTAHSNRPQVPEQVVLLIIETRQIQLKYPTCLMLVQRTLSALTSSKICLRQLLKPSLLKMSRMYHFPMDHAPFFILGFVFGPGFLLSNLRKTVMSGFCRSHKTLENRTQTNCTRFVGLMKQCCFFRKT